MFVDPMILDINGNSAELNRINQDGYSSEYLDRRETEEFRLTVRNTTYSPKGNKVVVVERHNVQLIHTVFPVAPETRATTSKAYFVIESDQGKPRQNVANVAAALAAFVGDPENVVKLLKFES
jgi:hypothetical protein